MDELFSEEQKKKGKVMEKEIYSIGQKLIDDHLGLRWVVRKQIPGGYKIQQDKEGGIIIDATPGTCSMKFSPVPERDGKIGLTMWSRDRSFRGTVAKLSHRYCAACGGDHDCYIVHWDDGTVTKPCASEVKYDKNGDLIIA